MLEPECKQTVLSYTKVESKNIQLNTAVVMACHTYIDKQCKAEVRRS